MAFIRPSFQMCIVLCEAGSHRREWLWEFQRANETATPAIPAQHTLDHIFRIDFSKNTWNFRYDLVQFWNEFLSLTIFFNFKFKLTSSLLIIDDLMRFNLHDLLVSSFLPHLFLISFCLFCFNWILMLKFIFTTCYRISLSISTPTDVQWSHNIFSVQNIIHCSKKHETLNHVYIATE